MSENHEIPPDKQVRERISPPGSQPNETVETQFDEMLEEYVETVQVNSDIIADVSRDIRDGLATVIGYSDLLAGEVDGAHRDDIADIGKAARGLMDSVRNLEDMVIAERRVRRVAETMRAILTIGAEAQDLQNFADRAFRHIETIADFDAVQLWLRDANDTVELLAQRCDDDCRLRSPVRNIPLHNSQIAPIFDDNPHEPSPHHLSEIDALDHYDPSIPNWLCVPLFDLDERRPIGMLAFGTAQRGPLDDIAEPLATQIGRHIATAVARSRQLSRFRSQAQTDPLTGIANRRHFFDVAASSTEQARQQNLPLTLLLIDIDHFKAFNDVYGHPAGDRMLKAVAETLGEYLRIDDLLGRYGGEEFVILLPRTKVEPEGRNIARRLVDAIEELSLVDHTDQSLSCTISIGAAGVRADQSDRPDLLELLQAADDALYRAKEKGRNRVEVAD